MLCTTIKQMPTYDYKCESCDYEVEIAHGFNAPTPKCETCKHDLKIVINQAPMAFIKGEAKTLGQLSEQNTKKMGRYELEDKRHHQQQGKVKEEKSWWQKSGDATSQEIGKMNAKQKAAYIKKGKK